jgi:hypothetical protein
MKQGEPTPKVIQELEKAAVKDPDDIKTFILLSKLLSENYKVQPDHVQRMKLREKALQYCESAFSKIDTYLDLQGISIDDVHIRDQIRVGFIKTISSIRNPLIKGS